MVAVKTVVEPTLTDNVPEIATDVGRIFETVIVNEPETPGF